jgi:carboxymethylenebutenolidase
MPSIRSISATVTTPDGTCPVTLHTPNGTGPWSAVVMYPDAGGVRPTFQEMAARLAGFGHAVLLPDVYYRDGDWEPFEMETVFGDPEQRKRLMTMVGSVTPDMIATDAAAFFDFLGRVPDRVAAAGSFHGGGLVTDDATSPHLLADQMKATVYVAGAENDASFTPEQAETLDKALTAANVTHTIEIYPAAHGFAVPDNPPYDKDAAERHWIALQQLFESALPH